MLIDGSFSEKQLAACPLEEDRREKLDPGVSRNSHFPFHCHYSRNRLVYFQVRRISTARKDENRKRFPRRFRARTRGKRKVRARKLSNRLETFIRKIYPHATRNYALEALYRLYRCDSFYRRVIKYHQIWYIS